MSLIETLEAYCGRRKILVKTYSDQPQVINSPFKWVGGKSRLRKHIVKLLPEHSCYLELFAGAAWVLFGKPPSDVEIINDIDQDLITFFRVLKDKPDELIAAFEWNLVSRAEFERLASLDPVLLTDVARAHRFYYLIMAGWGGEFHYPRFQTSISDGGHGNRLIGALKTLHERLEPVYHRLRTVIIENLNWLECFDRYDREGVVMYIDPPYPGNKCNYAHNMREWEQHSLLSERLHQSKCRWILSSYDIPEIHRMFSDHYIMAVQSASGMNTEKNGSTRVMNREVLVTNYPPARHLLVDLPAAESQQVQLELESKAEYQIKKPISNLLLLHSPQNYNYPVYSLLK
jgi:DNA adenine methylase